MKFFLLVISSLLASVITVYGRQEQRQQSLGARKFPRYDFFSRRGPSINKDQKRPLGFGPSEFLSTKVKGVLPRKDFAIARVLPRKDSTAARDLPRQDSTVAQDTEITDLVSKVSSLTIMLEEQSRTIKKLEAQTELLALLFKDKDSSTESKKTSPKTTTPPSKLVSSTPSYPDWNYSNQGTWSSDYPGCGKENQSPIDLRTVGVALKDHKSQISFSSYNMLNKDTCMVTNNGNTVTISMKTGTSSTIKPILSGGPFDSTKYLFTQAVFHWGADNSQGSEHTIMGTTYPLEMQLIHKTSSREEESDLAITSFLFEESDEENPFLAGLMTALIKIRTAGTEAELGKPEVAIEDKNTTKTDKMSKGAKDAFSMDLLIKDSISGPYFTYAGSQTFPPCTEVKQYVVFRDPIDISSTQLEQFRLLLQPDGTRMVNNFRSLKSLGNRVLAFTVSSDLISEIFNL